MSQEEFDKLRRQNAELASWIRDLLAENRGLRERLALEPEPEARRRELAEVA